MEDKPLTGKKIAMVLAFREFRDIEYFIPRNILSSAGAKIMTCSTEKGTAIGADGGDVRIDFTAQELNIPEYDAVVFIGGAGMVKNLDNADFHRIAQETIKDNKILAALCVAPALLAKAGVLENKRATVWSNNLDKSAVKILKESGAKYTEDDVVVDGNLLTGSGPEVAGDFAETIIQVLTNKTG